MGSLLRKNNVNRMTESQSETFVERQLMSEKLKFNEVVSKIVFLWERSNNFEMGLVKDYLKFREAILALNKLSLPLSYCPQIPVRGQSYKILIIAYDALGDFILTTPAFNLLLKSFPGSQLDLVCSERNFLLASKYDFFSNIHKLNLNGDAGTEDDKRKLQELSEFRYDFIVNLFDEPDDSAIVKMLMLSQKTNFFSLPIRFKSFWQQKLLKRQRLFVASERNTKEIPFALRMLRIAKVLRMDNEVDLVYSFPPVPPVAEITTNRKKILWNTMGSQRNNTLKEATVKSIAAGLAKADGDIFIFENAHTGLIQMMLSDKHISVLKSPDILVAASHIKKMDLVISTDTSLVHIATALSIPVLVIRSADQWRTAFDPLYGPNTVISSGTRKIDDIDLNLLNSTFTKMISNVHAEKN